MVKYIKISLLLIFSFLSVPAIGQITVSTLTTEFTGSGGVAVDSEGNIYVADFGSALSNADGKNVYRISPENGSLDIFANGLQGASGNGFDSNGNLFQSNIAGNKISKISPDGEVTDFASTTINSPVGVAVGNGDTVYVANCGNNTISKITPDGSATVFVSSNLFSCPNGLTFDDQGNLYTSNFNNGWIVKITPDKQVSNFANIPGNNNGHITFSNGRLYVVARCNNQIYEVELDGAVTLLAGNGSSGNEDGVDGQASFFIPNGIRASRTGDTLYVNSATSLDVGCTNSSLNPVFVRMITGVLLPRRSHGAPIINSITPAFADTTIAKGSRINFAIATLDTSGYNLSFSWTLNSILKSSDTSYAYRASSFGTPRSDTVLVSISNGFNTAENMWIVNVVDEITAVEDNKDVIPQKFKLYPNYPNPFNPSTNIEYVLQKNSYVILNIYNTLGAKIRTLVNQNQNAGTKSIIWNGKNDNGDSVGSGNYFFEITVDKISKTHKMILSK